MGNADAQKDRWIPFSEAQIRQIKRLASLSIPKDETTDRTHWIRLGRWDFAQELVRLNERFTQK